MTSEHTGQDDGKVRMDLRALDERLTAVKDPQRELLRLIVERTEQRDPDLAEAIRYAAIPRRLDATMLGVLRDRPDDESNAALVERLLELSFVHTVPDGACALDEPSRRALLEDWRAPDRRDAFDDLNTRMAAYYRAEHERGRELEHDVRRVARLVQAANPTRYADLVRVADQALRAPLVEVLYHETQRSTEDGYGAFVELCSQYERLGRLTMCQSLLDGARDAIEHRDDDDREGTLRWLRYWQARIGRQLGLAGEAEDALTKLVDEAGQDTTLRLWALSDLGILQFDADRLREAAETYRTEFELAKATGSDVFNLVMSHVRLGQIHYVFGELEEAIAEFRAGVAAGDAAGNNVGALRARLDLSAALQDAGQWAEGLDVALQALHLARTRTPTDPGAQADVAGRLVVLMAPVEPALADTAAAEADTLLAAVGDPLQAPRHRLRSVEAWVDSGQWERAEEQLAQLAAAPSGDEEFATRLLAVQALAAESRGRVEEASDLLTGVLDRADQGFATVWQKLAAFSNRGINRVRVGHIDAAEQDLRRAADGWTAIGDDMLAAFICAQLAEVHRRRGDPVKALELLELARPHLGHNPITYGADFWHVTGAVHEDAGRWSAAAEAHEQALAIYDALKRRQPAAVEALSLARVAGAQGRWDAAAGWAARAAETQRELAVLASHRPQETAGEADQLNAAGMRVLSDARYDAAERAARARESFRVAEARVPTNPWYQLNKSYACAQAGEWDEAIDALTAALEHPMALPAAFLSERLQECRLAVDAAAAHTS